MRGTTPGVRPTDERASRERNWSSAQPGCCVSGCAPLVVDAVVGAVGPSSAGRANLGFQSERGAECVVGHLRIGRDSALRTSHDMPTGSAVDTSPLPLPLLGRPCQGEPAQPSQAITPITSHHTWDRTPPLLSMLPINRPASAPGRHASRAAARRRAGRPAGSGRAGSPPRSAWHRRTACGCFPGRTAGSVPLRSRRP